jgi:hypothetical protein
MQGLCSRRLITRRTALSIALLPISQHLKRCHFLSKILQQKSINALGTFLKENFVRLCGYPENGNAPQAPKVNTTEVRFSPASCKLKVLC